jgi:hypothetical protein
MPRQNTQNVFCKDCESPALAQLDSVPYCTHCLLKRINDSQSKNRKRSIRPLHFWANSLRWRDYWPDVCHDGTSTAAIS